MVFIVQYLYKHLNVLIIVYMCVMRSVFWQWLLLSEYCIVLYYVVL